MVLFLVKHKTNKIFRLCFLMAQTHFLEQYQPLFIHSISKSTTDYFLNITLQSNTVEYGGTPESPVALGTPSLHTIWWDGNVLRYVKQR